MPNRTHNWYAELKTKNSKLKTKTSQLSQMANEEKRILIIRLSALGDVAMTVPAIYSLALRYPALKIDVVTRPFFARLFHKSPCQCQCHWR